MDIPEEVKASPAAGSLPPASSHCSFPKLTSCTMKESVPMGSSFRSLVGDNDGRNCEIKGENRRG